MFKNLYVFRFLEPVTWSVDTLQEQLAKVPFYSCGKMDVSSFGWSPPFKRESDNLVNSFGGCLFFTVRDDIKLLPASVVRNLVDERVLETEMSQSRKVKKREKNEIRDEVLHELVPRAFVQTTYLSAYIDVANGWLLVDTPNRKKAEEFTRFLRKTLGSLPVVPIKEAAQITDIMTGWLLHSTKCPSDIEIGDSCTLLDAEGDGNGVAHFKRQDLAADEIIGVVESGKNVSQLAINYGSKSFVLSNNLVVKSLKIADGDGGDDLIFFVKEVENLLKGLFKMFGGEEHIFEKGGV